MAENGAVALLNTAEIWIKWPATLIRKARAAIKIYQQDAATCADNFRAMQQVLARIEAEVLGARRATDSPGRETDIAIDHSEFSHLPQEAIDHACASCVRRA